MCKVHQIKQTVLQLDFGKTLTREMMEARYTNDMTAVLVNLHETSIGQLYDIDMLDHFCQDHGLLLIVDAISSFLADPINMESNHIDVMIFKFSESIVFGTRDLYGNPFSACGATISRAWH